ncbi:hypothetical protein jhhlp_003247 [Lomentospora prolificans]|uniref:Vacuolar membrane protein n=1 Tax=Lomentospora prolificans TaxID=41688 RepID=A0A2N3NGB5_9PEZI|nr:hypothetical protein jhhlp_003247 [Lomentospora prolificans]
MGCCGHRRKAVTGGTDQNWSYINLNDFKSTSCFTPFAYGYLWFSLLLSLAVYGVDTFTAVSLLALSDTWPSRIEPAVDVSISKWIFSACIIASFVNLGFEHVRAWRVMKRGNVSECYLDSLAVRLESIRLGKRQGWRRFLVFASLTKSKKGAEYIALFTYFSFQSWIRVIVCSGPRQVINALTLYSALQQDLAVPGGETIDRSLVILWNNITFLAQDNPQTALVLAGMIFTLIIWVFSLLFLIAAILFYILFLWHWIPQADGGLAGYCERKVNKALVKIVTKKVNKALAKEQAAWQKADFKNAKKLGEKGPLERQATLPTLPNVGGPGGDKLPEMPTLQRSETFSTLPPYVSRPGTPGSFELNNMDQKRPLPNRSGTMSSSTTYSSRAPLAASGADMGASSPLSPAPTLPSIDFGNSYGPPALRPNTSNSQRSFSRPGPGHMQNGSNASFGHQPYGSQSSIPARYTETPSNYGGESMPYPTPVRSPTARTMDSYNRPPMPQGTNGYPLRSPTAGPGSDRFSPMDGRASPAPSAYSSRSGPGLPTNPTPRPLNPSGYQAFQPSRSVTGPLPVRTPQPPQPTRNMTTGDYHPRQQPSQGSGYGYDYDVESQRGGQY